MFPDNSGLGLLTRDIDLGSKEDIVGLFAWVKLPSGPLCKGEQGGVVCFVSQEIFGEEKKSFGVGLNMELCL